MPKKSNLKRLMSKESLGTIVAIIILFSIFIVAFNQRQTSVATIITNPDAYGRKYITIKSQICVRYNMIYDQDSIRVQTHIALERPYDTDGHITLSYYDYRGSLMEMKSYPYNLEFYPDSLSDLAEITSTMLKSIKAGKL